MNHRCMKFVIFVSILFCAGSFSQPIKKKNNASIFRSLDFSYTDSYDEIISFRIDSNHIFQLSKNESLIYGKLPDSIFNGVTVWNRTY